MHNSRPGICTSEWMTLSAVIPAMLMWTQCPCGGYSAENRAITCCLKTSLPHAVTLPTLDTDMIQRHVTKASRALTTASSNLMLFFLSKGVASFKERHCKRPCQGASYHSCAAQVPRKNRVYSFTSRALEILCVCHVYMLLLSAS